MTTPVTYIVVMDRLGRKRNPPPFAVVSVCDSATASADIADALYKVARNYCRSIELLAGADTVSGAALVSAGGRDAGRGRIHRADICLCRDESCPKCGYAETYAAGRSTNGGFPAPFALGCRKCGWVELLAEATS